MNKLFLTIILLCFLATTVQAAEEVILAWDANSETDLSGYRIFYRQEGQSYDYDNPIWQGIATTCTVTVPEDGYFVARAFDLSGNESVDSNQVDTIDPAKVQNLRRGDL